MTNFQTPLTQIKRQGSAPNGLAHWKGQRLSAAALIFLSVWLVIEILRHAQSDYPAVLSWAAQPWIGSALALFVGMVFYHSALGLQVVIEDYVSDPFWQTALILKVKALSLIMAVLAWFFIIRIAILKNG